MPGHSHYKDYTDLRGDGRIVLYKRRDHDNPKWTARIKIPGATGYVVRSTKTPKDEEARRFAEDLYYELEGRVRRGETLKSPQFKKVFEEWQKELPFTMKDLSPQYIEGNIRLIENHSLGFIGNDAIDKISESRLLEYFNHRLTAGKKPPASTSLRHERTILNQIFKFAKKRGYIHDIPEVPVPPMKRNPRPDINRQDWNTLYKFRRGYVKNSADSRRHRERLYLQQFILILGNSGIRVGEARRLRWVDVSSSKTVMGEDRMVFTVTGKTGEREVVCNPGVEKYIKRLWEYRSKELGETPAMNEPVFCHKDGKPIVSFKKGFRRALDEAGVLYGNDGQIRVPYSLRHTYITMRLTEGVSVYQLAVNTGTSVEMIEDFYGKKKVRDPRNVTEITKTSKRRDSGDDGVLPWE
jgi:integrase